MLFLAQAVKISSRFVLALAIALPPGLLYRMPHAFATEGTSDSSDSKNVPLEQAVVKIAEANEKNVAKFNEEISALDQILRGMRVGVHPLDPFGALSQRIVHHGPSGRWLPTRRENLNIVLGDYLEITERLTPEELKKYLNWMFTDKPSADGAGTEQILNGDEFGDQIKLAAHFGELSQLSEGKLTHLVKEVADRMGIRADEALRFLEHKYNVFKNPRSVLRKLDARLIETLADIDEKGRVIRARDFKGSTNFSFNTGNLVWKQPTEWSPVKPSFSFFAAGKVVEEFSLPVQAAFFYGDYLILLEPNSFIEEQGIHYLTFIDLKRYESVLGKFGLPLFKIPIATTTAINDIRIERGTLMVQGEPVELKSLKAWSEVGEMYFNAYSNVMDTASTPAAAARIADFAEFTAVSVQKLKGETGNEEKMNPGQLELFEKHSKLMIESLARQNAIGKVNNYADLADKLGANYMQEQQFQNALKLSAERAKMNRSVLNRAQLFLAHISVPRPDGIPVLQKAFAHMASAFMQKKNKDLSPDQYLREGTLQLLHHPYARWGIAVTGAAIVGAINPEFASQMLYSTASFVQASIAAVFGKVTQVGYWGYETVRQTFGGFSPMVMYDLVKTAGHYLMAGITSTTGIVLGSALGAWWSVALMKMAYDVHEANITEPVKGPLFKRIFTRTVNVLKTVNAKTIIAQQRALKIEDLKGLSQSARQAGDEASKEEVKFTSAQDQQVHDIIAKLNAEREAKANENWVLSTVKSIKTNARKVWHWVRKKDMPDAQAIAAGSSDPKEIAEAKIKTLGSAIGHMLMSWPSLAASQKLLAKFVWNSWFLTRSFFFHPIVVANSIARPDYAFVATRDRNNLTLPTDYNGGKRWLPEYLKLLFFQTDHLDELRAWEEKMMGVEGEIHKAAIKAAFKATLKLANDMGDLRKLYASGRVDNWGHGAIKSLDTKMRVFFRNYSAGIQEAATQAFLRDHFRNVGVPLAQVAHVNDLDEMAEDATLDIKAQSGDRAALLKLKDRTATILNGLTISETEAAKYVAEAAADTKAYENSKKLATGEGLWKFARAFENTLVQKPLAKLDRQNNRQIDRVFIVNEKLADPQAVARGVRYVASGWKVSYPLSIVSMILFLAGLENNDMLQLVHPGEMFSDDSFMYLSRYVVLGMILSMGLSVVGGADLWMKVQIDEMHDGKFNERLEGKEAEMSLLRLWLHKSFGNKDNTLMQNHKHYINRIMLPNMKAALFNYGLHYFATIGRFDAGAYLMSYVLAFTLPKFAFDTMTDQGFELASSSYLTTKFPPELLAHPRVQEFINKESARWRDFYNLGNKVYEESSGRIVENLELLSTDKIGPRTMERIFFGGWSVAELAYQGLENVQEIARPIPGVGKVLDTCQYLLTNNMSPTMFREIAPPPWIRQGP